MTTGMNFMRDILFSWVRRPLSFVAGSRSRFWVPCVALESSGHRKFSFTDKSDTSGAIPSGIENRRRISFSPNRISSSTALEKRNSAPRRRYRTATRCWPGIDRHVDVASTYRRSPRACLLHRAGCEHGMFPVSETISQ